MKYGILCLLLLTFVQCKQPEEKQPENTFVESETTVVETSPSECQGSFAHNVYIWLKRPDMKEDQEAFLESLNRFLDASEYIVSSHVGYPVPSERDVVDDSFSFSIVLTFKNKEDQDLYQVEPVHLKFVEESSHLWNKVVVYDSMNLRE
ncbi:MAG: hypothetical protein Aureis2KO_11100 [Aureisphaera sp.]